MSSDLRTLLDRGVAPRPTTVDGDLLVARGRRRHAVKRTVGGVAAGVALLAGVGVLATVTDPAPPPVITPAPGTDDITWTRTADAPIVPRERPLTAVDGDRVLVWGGESAEPYVSTTVGATTFVTIVLQDGGVYDAETDSWQAVPAPPLSVRTHPEVRLAGDLVLVWGGLRADPAGVGAVPYDRASLLLDGAVHDLRTDRWTPIPPAPLRERSLAVVDWDGEQLLVWGGQSESGEPLVDGAVWSADRGWRTIAPFPLSPRAHGAVALDADRLVTWGGATGVDEDGRVTGFVADGALYDRAADAWTVLPASGLSPRWFGGYGGANALLDGDTLLLLGGVDERTSLTDGARLDLATGTWTPVTDAPLGAEGIDPRPGGIIAHQFSADGDEYRFWLYDPATDAWSTTGTARYGDALYVDGVGYADAPDGVRLDPDGSWHPVSLVLDDNVVVRPVLTEDDSPRDFPVTVALESGVWLWGGASVEVLDELATQQNTIRPAHGWLLRWP